TEEREQMRRIGVLIAGLTANDSEGQLRMAAFRQGLQSFGCHAIWPHDSAEPAQAFPRTVYLESRYGTQCSPRSLFSHSIILAAYTLAKTPAGDRVNVRNALP